MAGNQPGTSTAIVASLNAIMNPVSPRDRDAAEWAAASDIAKHPEDYAPKHFLFARSHDIEPWFKLSHDALVAYVNADPGLFGAYRLAVLDYEGRCAKQLDALAWSMRTLFRLRDRPGADVARIDAAAEPIAELLQSGWGVPDGFLQLSQDRTWTTRFTRRYDLLPKAWRVL